MTDRMRWRYGDTNPVVAEVDESTAIEIGDLLYQDVDDAKPVSMQPDQGTETANQTLAAENFLGVAMQRSRDGDTEPVRVATSGTFEFDCPAGTFELGDHVGIDENAAGTALLNQQIAPVGSSALAIGRAARRQGESATTVLVSVCSTVMAGGVAGASPSA